MEQGELLGRWFFTAYKGPAAKFTPCNRPVNLCFGENLLQTGQGFKQESGIVILFCVLAILAANLLPKEYDRLGRK